MFLLNIHQFFVVLDSPADYLHRLGLVEKLLDRRLLVFKLLVDREKVLYFVENVGRELVDRLDAVICGVGEWEGDYLVVLLYLYYFT